MQQATMKVVGGGGGLGKSIGQERVSAKEEYQPQTKKLERENLCMVSNK
jgi:hypothetical protein